MNRRILIVDDNPDIHGDFKKILGRREEQESFRSARSAFLGGDEEDSAGEVGFDLGHAHQGEEGLELLRRGCAEERPFSVAFVDVRMPPGWDGIQTIKRLWEEDGELQAVICTAYADYSFEEIVAELGSSDRLLILKKPFDPVEVRQLAVALTEKWDLIQRNRVQLAGLEKAEAEARAYAAALERSNQELAEATRQAQAASRAKSEFLANMSHEIRTPMTGILGYGELICDPSVPLEDRLRYGDIIKRSGSHLLTVLNDILDISRIESGRMEIDRRESDPAEVVREVYDLMSPRAAEKGLDLEIDWAEAIPTVIRTDAQRVRQVLVNLAANAIKFTERGGVTLRVRTEQAGAEGARLLFEVIDTGIGIDAAELPTLFDPFTQADTSSTREAGGNGLGLAISKRLALMLGGGIDVESEPGRGSTFTLKLELGDLASYELARPDLEAEREAAHRELAAVPELDARVLLVEDGAVNQLLIATVLRNAGAEVDIADDGRAGCRMVREARSAGRPYDLVLMDMQMPVMDGYEATRTLRAEGYELPIVALTAHAMTGDRERCLEAGCTDYATKPVDRKLLIELCGDLVRDRREAGGEAA